MIFKGKERIFENAIEESTSSTALNRKVELLGVDSFINNSMYYNVPIDIISLFNGVSGNTTLQINQDEAKPIYFLTEAEQNNITSPNYNNWVYKSQIYTVYYNLDLDGFICIPPNSKSNINSDNIIDALGYTPAELDESGKVLSSQLPSYVDDVLEYNSEDNFPETGESGKIYISLNSNKTYRWSGSVYVELSESVSLGTTSSTAFRGDYGNTAYQHANKKGLAFASGLYKITTNDQGHVTSAVAVTKSDITALGIPSQDTTYNTMTGATVDTAGTLGLVPAPSIGSQDKFLKGDGTWSELNEATLQSLTIQKNGSSLDTYNGSESKIINIIVPTKVSELTNDEQYQTASDVSNASVYKASRDNSENLIDATYLKNVSVQGQKTILTKGNGTTSTVSGYTVTPNNSTSNTWHKLGTFNTKTQGAGGEIWLFGGRGQNNAVYQNMWAHLFIKKGYQGATASTTNYVAASYEIFVPPSRLDIYKNVKFKVFCTEIGIIDVWVYFPFPYSRAYYYPAGEYNSFTVANTEQTEEPVEGDTYGVEQPCEGGIIVSSSNGTSIDEVIKTLSINGKTITYTKGNGTTGTLTTQDTTYTGTNGINISGTSISNSGVRSISSGSTNGTISVNTNGTSANIAVKGLNKAAYKDVDSSISNSSTSNNIPTSSAVATFVENKGYKTTDTNTTYTLTQDSSDGHILTLTPSTGNPTTITIPDNDTKYNNATQTTAGLMSPNDKIKLDKVTTHLLINGDFIKYNVQEGTDITEYVSVDNFNNIDAGDIISYTSTTGTGYSRMILSIKRYTTGTVETLTMFIVNDNVYTGTPITEISFSIDSDYDPDAVFLGPNGPYSGGGGVACFTEDTLVLTDNGLKPIKDIKVDDLVVSYNFETKEQELKPITAIISHKVDYVINVVSDNNTIKATGDHPVYTNEFGKINVAQLNSNCSLLMHNNIKDNVINISLEDKQYTVYDISVKDNHNYYVGQKPVLVYNESITNIYN